MAASDTNQLSAHGNSVSFSTNDDDFELIEYNINYRSENGRLSKYLKAKYKDGTQKDIHIDGITQAQPNLSHAKQQALKIMDDYNANFILGSAFPVVFQILTLGTSMTPVSEIPGVTSQRSMASRSIRVSPARTVAVLESKGVIRPGKAKQTHVDPFSGNTYPIMATAKTERSLITSIRADVAESEGYKAALLRKEIGLQRPTGANIAGADFITAVLRPGTKKVQEVLATDVKASVAGKFPVPKTAVPGSWRTEIQNAVSAPRLNLGDPDLEAEVRLAVQQGRIRIRQLNINYSSQGQGQITGW